MNSASRPATPLALGFGHTLAEWARERGANPATAAILQSLGEALSMATSEGQICIDLGAHVGCLSRLEFARLREQLLASGVVMPHSDSRPCPLVLDEANRLYLFRYFALERRLAQALVARSQEPSLGLPQERLRTAIDEVSGAPAAAGAVAVAGEVADEVADEKIDWQRVALAQALLNQLTVICGGPGTGKTRTAARLIELFLTLRPGAVVMLAAPTGKAAARLLEVLQRSTNDRPGPLREQLPTQAFTVHRLLQIGGPRKQARFDAEHPLPCDLLILDEASMLDLALAVQLIDALPANACCVLLGDPQQLTAVESGSILGALTAQTALDPKRIQALANLTGFHAEALRDAIDNPPTGSAPMVTQGMVRLTKTHRFSADSKIHTLSQAIAQGDGQTALQLMQQDPTRQLQWLEATTDELEPQALAIARNAFGPFARAVQRYCDAALMGAQAGTEPGEPASAESTSTQNTLLDEVFKNFESFRVLTAVREGPRGLETLNRWLRGALEWPSVASHKEPPQWFAGRPVVMTRNDYATNLFNGDLGICLPAWQASASEETRLSVYVREGSGFRAFAPSRIPAHEESFASTVHKAQGAEFDTVQLILPIGIHPSSHRALLYTAVTRARQRFIVCGAAAVFTHACATAQEHVSGLADRMREALDTPPEDAPA